VKGTIPKGAKLSIETNLWFEAKVLAELERLPTLSWGDMAALWGTLPSAWPSTRRRILTRCLELASERGDALPAELVKRFARPAIRELGVSKPRGRVHHDLDRAQDGLRKLARHLARNPRASLSELAAAAGSKKTTVRLWKARPDFQAYLNDEHERERLARLDSERLDSERREHEQRGRAARRSKKRSSKKELLNG
jgi:hypothetical protein